MVDIIKSFLPVPALSATNIHRRQNRSSSKQVFLPMLVSTIDNVPQNDRTSFFKNNKQWTRGYPRNILPQLDISHPPYGIHRKVIDHELTRCHPTTTVDMSATIKIKQQQQKHSNKESLKITTVTATTVTSTPVLSGVDSQNSRLFDALSKHVTIKSEPLRPANYFLNNKNKILSSWQKYWKSTDTQRRRKKSNDLEFISNRTILDQQPLLATTHFVTVHDASFYTTNDNYSHSRKSSSVSNCSALTKLSSPIVSDEQSSFIKEEDHSCLLPSVINLSMNPLSSIQSENLIINNDDKMQDDINSITTKLYKLPLSSNKPKVNKSILKRRSRSKSSEKKATKSPALHEEKETASVSKSKHQTSSNKSHRTAIKKQESLSTIITTTARSKYEGIKWDEPYVGVRCDPPTPPCSPSLFVWPEDSDHDENDISVEQKRTKLIIYGRGWSKADIF